MKNTSSVRGSPGAATPTMRRLSPMLLVALAACGGGGSDDTTAPAVDNSKNQWAVSNSIGFSGGNVVLSGQRIVGEYQPTRVVNKSGGGNSFISTSSYAVTNVKFDDSGRYLEYWMSFTVVGGSVVSNAAWTPVGSYGVSQDGTALIVDKYSSRKTYQAKGTRSANGQPCITVSEAETGDEYDLCKVQG